MSFDIRRASREQLEELNRQIRISRGVERAIIHKTPTVDERAKFNETPMFKERATETPLEFNFEQ